MPTKTKYKPAVDITADWLKQFCGGADHRWTIDSPWTRGGRTYATNGHIAVRLNKRIPGVGRLAGKAPDVEAVLDGIGRVAEWVEVPRKTCRCLHEPCIYCDEGIWKCNCPTCKTKHRCARCDGTGKDRNCCVCHVVVLNRTLALKELSKLYGLPGLACGAESYDSGVAVYFLFDGGVAALMPVTKDR